MITAKWFVVNRKIFRGANRCEEIAPWCAFENAADAEGLLSLKPGQRETKCYVILERPVNIGGTDAMQLLADIVSNDNSLAGNRRMIRAIEVARKILGLPNQPKAAVDGRRKTPAVSCHSDSVLVPNPFSQL